MNTEKVTWEQVKNQFVIANDYVFGSVMGEPDICTEFIRTVLPEIQLAGLVDVVRQSAKNISMEDKSIRLDIEARDTDGRVYDIEMQNVNQKEALEQRIRYYGSLLDCDKIKKGEPYHNLPNLFIIFVCAFDYLGKGSAIYDFSMRDQFDSSLEFSDGRRVILINCSNPRFSPSPKYEKLMSFVKYVRTNIPNDSFTERINHCVLEYKKVPAERKAFMEFMSRDWVAEKDRREAAIYKEKANLYKAELERAEERMQKMALEIERLKSQSPKN